MAGLWEKWLRPHREGELGLDDTDPAVSQIVGTFTTIAAVYHNNLPINFRRSDGRRCNVQALRTTLA
jgi:hypothetical protein